MTTDLRPRRSTDVALSARIFELERDCAVLRDRNNLAARMLEVHRVLASKRDADGIVTALLHALRDPLGFSRAFYATVDRDRGVEVRMKTEDGGAVEAVSESIEADEGSALLQVLRGETFAVGLAHELSAPVIDVRGWYALCSLPLATNASAIVYADGHVTRETEPYTDFVRSLCAVAAIALENERSLSITRELAETDPLTGLLNRRGFEPRLRALFAMPARTLFAYLFVDVDDFKTVNDTRGHAGGDTVLKTVAAALQQTSRTRDIVGRYAGDEFTVVLIDVDEERARSLVRRLSATLRLSGIRCSIGVALYPSDATNESQLMRAADEALYVAKQNGKNGYAFYRSRKAREE